MNKGPLGFDPEAAFDYENGFYLTSPVSRLGKLVAHYDLYRRIVDLPGQILELGVFKGASLIRWSTFRELLESPDSRKIVGFDAFGAFPVPQDERDAAYAVNFEDDAGTGISEQELDDVMSRKGIRNYELVGGDILSTLPEYIQAHPELRVALLHIDTDVYEPARVALELVGPKMVPGGLIVLDDYPTVDGETRAVDEYLAATGRQIHKLPVSHVPSFIVAA